MATERALYVRVGVKDADRAAAALRGIGADGEAAARRIELASSKAGPALTGLDRAAGAVRGGMASMAGPVASVAGGLGGLGAAGLVAGGGLAAVAAAAVALIGQSVAVAGRFQAMEASLRAVGGSAVLARAEMDMLTKFAAHTAGVGIDKATEGFIKLKALGLDPSTDALRSYASTSAAMGKDVMQFVEAVADAVTGENERLKEFGIKAAVAGDKVRYTFQGVTTEVENNATAIEKYLQSIGNTKFGTALEEQANTLSGAVETLSDNWTIFLANLGNSGPVDWATSALRSLGEGVGWLNDHLFPSLEKQIADNEARLATWEQKLRSASGVARAAATQQIAAIQAETDALKAEKAAREAALAKSKEEAAEKRKQATADAKAAKAKEEAAKAAEKQGKKDAEEAARAAARAADGAAAIDRQIAALKDEEAQLSMTARERAMHTAMLKAEETARQAGTKVTDEQAAALRREAGALYDRERAAEAAKQAAEQAKDAAADAAAERAKRAEEAARESRRQMEGLYDDLVDVGADTMDRIFDGAKPKEFFDDVLSWGRKAFARLAAEAIIRPIMAPMMGGVAGGGGAAGGVMQAAGVGTAPTGQAGIGGFGWSSLSLPQGWQDGIWEFAFNDLGLSSGLSDALAGGIGAAPWGMAGMVGANLLGLGKGKGGQIGGMLGSVAGGIGGSALGSILGMAGGPVGVILGGFLGSAVGGLFKSKPSDKEGNAVIDLASGGVTIGGMTGKKYSAENREAAGGLADSVKQLAGLFNALAPGVSLSGQAVVRVGDRDGIRAEYGGQKATFARDESGVRELASWFSRQFGAELGDKLPADISTALANVDFGDLESALSDLNFAGAFRKIFDKAETFGPIETQVRALSATLSEASARAQRLGLDTSDLSDGWAAAVARLVEPQQAVGPFAAALTDLDKALLAARASGVALGADMEAAFAGAAERVRQTLRDSLSAQINEASGKGYLNSAAAAVAEFEANAAELAAAGDDGAQALSLLTARLSGLLSGLSADQVAEVTASLTAMGGAADAAVQAALAKVAADQEAAEADRRRAEAAEQAAAAVIAAAEAEERRRVAAAERVAGMEGRADDLSGRGYRNQVRDLLAGYQADLGALAVAGRPAGEAVELLRLGLQRLFADLDGTQIADVVASFGDLSGAIGEVADAAADAAKAAAQQAAAEAVAATAQKAAADAKDREALAADRVAAARARLLDAMQAERAALASSVDAWHRAAQSLRAGAAGLLQDGELSPLSDMERLAAAERDYRDAVARAGSDPAAAAELPELARAYLAQLRAVETREDVYAVAFGRVQADLAAAATRADAQVSVAQQQLAAMDVQISAIQGVEGAVLSVGEAMAQYQAAVSEYQAAIAAAAMAAAEAARAAAAAAGTAASAASAMASERAAADAAAPGTLPKFARGGFLPAGRVGVAGETGRPELVFGPAWVARPEVTAAMMGRAPVNDGAALDRLGQRLVAANAAGTATIAGAVADLGGQMRDMRRELEMLARKR
jgi:hypothetical protein